MHHILSFGAQNNLISSKKDTRERIIHCHRRVDSGGVLVDSDWWIQARAAMHEDSEREAYAHGMWIHNWIIISVVITIVYTP